MHTYINAYIHTLHASCTVQLSTTQYITYMHYVNTYITCSHPRIHACMCACIHIHSPHTCIHAYMQICIHTYMHRIELYYITLHYVALRDVTLRYATLRYIALNDIHTLHMYTYITCIHTYIHTYIQTYLTYIHT